MMFTMKRIVTGTGLSEGEELLLGSVTKHMLREAGCDVLVVSPERLKGA